jgi:rubrerythrin
MSLAKTFYLLKDAETRTGELYAMIGLSVSVTRPDLFDLFSELAEEEEVHARQVEMMRNIFLECQDAFLATPDAERMIAGFVENVDMIKNNFNQRHAQLQPRDLIELALDIENSLVERHRTFIFKVTDLQVTKLFESLNLGNINHINKLRCFPLGDK